MFRLTNEEIRLITWYFQDAAGAMGLRSNHASIEARLAMGLVGDGGPASVDPFPDWSAAVRKDATRAHRALRSVADGPDGPMNLLVLFWAFGAPHDARRREKLLLHLRERFGATHPWRELVGLLEHAPEVRARKAARARRQKRFDGLFDADALLIESALRWAVTCFDIAARAYSEALLVVLEDEERHAEARASRAVAA
jgi:hypothetical protein